MAEDRAALVARLRQEAHDLDAAYRSPEDGPSLTSALLLEAADALSTPPVPPCAPACADDVCLAAQRDGILCADGECDHHSGVRHPSTPPAPAETDRAEACRMADRLERLANLRAGLRWDDSQVRRIFREAAATLRKAEPVTSPRYPREAPRGPREAVEGFFCEHGRARATCENDHAAEREAVRVLEAYITNRRVLLESVVPADGNTKLVHQIEARLNELGHFERELAALRAEGEGR